MGKQLQPNRHPDPETRFPSADARMRGSQACYVAASNGEVMTTDDRHQDTVHQLRFDVRGRILITAATILLGMGLTACTQNPNAMTPLQDPTPKKQGVTLIADYSNNHVIEVDNAGTRTWTMQDAFGVFDAEIIGKNDLLVTEFSVSRVSRVDRDGKQIWAYEDLRNPYDADGLANGNILIADTFAGRVIEVQPSKTRNRGGIIVWSYDKDIRPFDVERLANGNTLIADVLHDRVLEVDPEGKVTWQAKGMKNVHDADRLPNGNTLITLRNRGAVIEINPAGIPVWKLEGLSSPSDADRLPNGNTLVAENKHIREFDKDGQQVWQTKANWAVEVNRHLE